MTTIPLVDLKAQYATIQPAIDQAIARILDTTAFVMGADVRAFEDEFAAFCETSHAIGVSSGTDALHLALRACGVGAGDEVITVSHTFIATAEAISMCGARPVFVDIHPDTYNIAVDQIEPAITPRTKAIIVVHLYGQPADMDPLLALAQQHNLYLIEDAAQAHGARYRGKRVGGLGHIGCFSFYPGKNLGGYGDGGAVTTNDSDLAERVRLLRNHGRHTKYEHLIEGFCDRLDTLQAAVLRVKLAHLEEWNQQRRAVAALYQRFLADCDGIRLPVVPDWAEPVWHLYVVQVQDRAALQAALKEAGIATGIHYPIPLHLQPAYQFLGYKRGDLPHTEAAVDQIVSLPMYPELSEQHVQRVASVLSEGVRSLTQA
jgi:dTDP-4-amino-4,6-dideoxygalactose transaminase